MYRHGPPLTPAQTRHSTRSDPLYSPRSPEAVAGSHSLWCHLLLVEGDECRPVAADDVVVTVLEERLLLRISSTAFCFSIVYDDIKRVVLVLDTDELEIHVALDDSGEGVAPGLSASPSQWGNKVGHTTSDDEEEEDEEAQVSTRMYVLHPAQRDVVSTLYDLVIRRVSRKALLYSEVLTEGLGTYWTVHPSQQPLFDAATLASIGLREVPLSSGAPSITNAERGDYPKQGNEALLLSPMPAAPPGRPMSGVLRDSPGQRYASPRGALPRQPAAVSALSSPFHNSTYSQPHSGEPGGPSAEGPRVYYVQAPTSWHVPHRLPPPSARAVMAQDAPSRPLEEKTGHVNGQASRAVALSPTAGTERKREMAWGSGEGEGWLPALHGPRRCPVVVSMDNRVYNLHVEYGPTVGM